MKTFLILCCIAGIVIPWWFALPFFNLVIGLSLALLLKRDEATTNRAGS